MENTGNQNKPKSNNKNYYRKNRNKPKGQAIATDIKSVQEAQKHVQPPPRPPKVRKLSEETVSDILKDIDRIEKEIELEIKEIQSAKLSF